MLTTAVFGLLNRNQAFFAANMTQLRVFDYESAALSNVSDFSDSESEENKDSDKKILKSTYTDKIAKNIVTSLDRVDKRMLKLHGVVKKPKKKTDLIGFLGLRDSLKRQMSAKLDPVPKNSLPFDSTKL